MIPYIVLLVILIVVILWQVYYSQKEYFQGESTTLKTYLADLENKLPGYISRLQTLADKASKQTFVPVISDPVEFQQIIFLGTTQKLPKTTSEFVQIVNRWKIEYSNLLTSILKNEIRTPDLGDRFPTLQSAEAFVIDRISSLLKAVSILENVYNNSAPASATNDAPLQAKPTALSSVLSDLLGTTPTSAKKTTAADATATGSDVDVQLTKSKEQVVCSTPDLTEKVSAAFNKELEDRIAKNIATQIKDELVSKHQLQGAIDNLTPNAPCDSGFATEGTSQGSELQQAKPALKQSGPIASMLTTESGQALPSPQPDMSQYVRKDSVPCWGCNLAS